MKVNKKPDFIDVVIIFAFFILANLPAWVFRLWRDVEYIYVETALWLFLVSIALFKLKKEGRFAGIGQLLKREWFFLSFILFWGLTFFCQFCR